MRKVFGLYNSCESILIIIDAFTGEDIDTIDFLDYDYEISYVYDMDEPVEPGKRRRGTQMYVHDDDRFALMMERRYGYMASATRNREDINGFAKMIIEGILDFELLFIKDI